MFFRLFSKIFGTRNDKLLKLYYKILNKVNLFEAELKTRSNESLKQRICEIKCIACRCDNLDDFLPEVYAIVREVSYRLLGMRHYDVQILGGIALYYGKIAELATGEGKTLVATLPACLVAIGDKCVHIVTVNDYLAKRDSYWMTPIYQFFGLTIGTVVSNINSVERKKAYSADVIYGTNNEFGFDYLRDNIIVSAKDKVQNELFYVIIDEVDSILIDEARTPLIISSPSCNDKNIYLLIDGFVKHFNIYDKIFRCGDFIIDEKNKQVQLTDSGFLLFEKLCVKYNVISNTIDLYNANNINLLNLIYAALKAHYLFRKDVDYIIMDNQVFIIDEHTGRIMEGRRWSDGVHQALEVKESVVVRQENNILASITFQNYFRLYKRVAGMTGTANTEAVEFYDIYKLEVVVIPSNLPNIRIDYKDLIFLTKKSKFITVVNDIRSCVKKGQPILIGTISIEVSEYLSKLLSKINIKHNVLNAKNHYKEADIISKAGRPGGVTIATNMAGRGTDIVLGKLLCVNDNKLNYEDYSFVVKSGGLKVIGTERHESRRIDNQLRGRAARQGDPGCSQFYLSLEDDLVRIFISDRIAELLNKISIGDNEIISHSLVNKAIEKAQLKVEAYHYNMRKQLLEFDDVVNEQRKVIYEQRNLILMSDSISVMVSNIMRDVSIKFIVQCLDVNKMEESIDYEKVFLSLNIEFGLNLVYSGGYYNNIEDVVFNKCVDLYESKEKKLGYNDFRLFEKVLFLNILDLKWKEHLALLDHIRQSVHLRGYAQKDPKQEYKKDAFLLFSSMLDYIKHEFIVMLLRFPVDVINEDANINFNDLNYNHAKVKSLGGKKNNINKPFIRQYSKLSRNAFCYCGSKKKYKRCHGKDI